jgi:hypothetical protein
MEEWKNGSAVYQLMFVSSLPDFQSSIPSYLPFNLLEPDPYVLVPVFENNK